MWQFTKPAGRPCASRLAQQWRCGNLGAGVHKSDRGKSLPSHDQVCARRVSVPFLPFHYVLRVWRMRSSATAGAEPLAAMSRCARVCETRRAASRAAGRCVSLSAHRPCDVSAAGPCGERRGRDHGFLGFPLFCGPCPPCSAHGRPRRSREPLPQMESGIGNSGAGAGAASGGAGATRGFASVGGGRVNARATQGEALGGGSGLDARPGFYAPVGPPGTGFGVGAGSGAGAGPSLGEASGSGVGSSMDSDLAEMGAQRRRAAARLYGSCPICGKVMVKSSLSMHADKCAERLEKESKRSGGGKGGSQRKSQTPTPAEHRKKPGPKPGSRAKAAKRRTPEGGAPFWPQ